MEKSLKDNNNYGPFPGMILQVLSPEYEENYGYNVDDDDGGDDGRDITTVEFSLDKAIRSRKIRVCVNYDETYLNGRKENDADVDARGVIQYVNEYVLLEQVHPELGLVDRHNRDFAYTPIIRPPILNYQADQKYEKMGDRAFAGGSHGEVWRARRRCPNSSSYHKRKNDEKYANSSSDPFLAPCDEQQELIMKRLKIEHGLYILEAGLREVYFGDLLSRQVADASNLFTKYVDHFFRETTSERNEGEMDGEDGGEKGELWIVFENAGPSLRSYLYTQVETGDFIVYEHSSFWRKLRRSVHDNRKASTSSSVSIVDTSSPHVQHHPKSQAGDVKHDGNKSKKHRRRQEDSSKRRDAALTEGGELLKEVLRQVLTSAANLHDLGIIHRDIKPSNIMCKIRQIEESKSNVPGFAHSNGAPDMEIESVHCVLGDFSSGYDEFTSQNMYLNGPSAAEQTDEYAPPE
eukprot:7597844-Ditylum_brightwellii.AAC.1